MSLQLLADNGRCTDDRYKAHHWDIKPKLFLKDTYVWAKCGFCSCVRLYRFNMPRLNISYMSDAFEEIDDKWYMRRALSVNEDIFAEDIEKRKRAEKKYFKRDELILSELFGG